MDKLKQMYLDANAVLRYVLQDIDEQYIVVFRIVKNEYCIILLWIILEYVIIYCLNRYLFRRLRIYIFSLITQNSIVY